MFFNNNSTLSINMNRKLILSTVLMIALAFVSNVTSAQTFDVVLSESGTLQLPTDQPLKASYTFSIASLQLANEEAYQEFFDARSTDLIVYRVMASDAKAVIMISRSKRPEWSIIDWNQYLLEQTTINPIRN